jgi:hypothetical protein
LFSSQSILIQQIVLKRASNEAGISAPKLNLRKAIALQQIEPRRANRAKA